MYSLHTCIHIIISVKVVCAHHCIYNSRRCRQKAGCRQRQSYLINTLMFLTNAVSRTAQSDSDSDRSKKRNTDSALSMITNALNSIIRDTPVIMLGRALGHHICAWDLRYGPRLATMRTKICKYTAKLVALTIMVVIGLWMCHGEGHQHHK